MFAKHFKEKIKGGKSSSMKPEDFDQDQLKMGIRIEMEHTTDKAIAMEIAMDHLAEHSDYYTRLNKAKL